MLTCEEIAERVRTMNVPVNRTTYHEIAQRIHPCVPRPKVEDDDDRPPPSGPEWDEHRRRSNDRTEDWTDMVVYCVTLWQWWAALDKQRRVGAILERYNV